MTSFTLEQAALLEKRTGYTFTWQRAASYPGRRTFSCLLGPQPGSIKALLDKNKENFHSESQSSGCLKNTIGDTGAARNTNALSFYTRFFDSRQHPPAATSSHVQVRVRRAGSISHRGLPPSGILKIAPLV
jgi:hypothetical protein